MKTHTETVIKVWDWNELVTDTYKRPYNFQQQDGCQERGSFYLTVPSETTDDEDMAESIPEVINGEKWGLNSPAG